MCELLAMSSREPATVSFSLDEFARHGGYAGSNMDGWGVTFYEGRDVRTVREPLAAWESPAVEFVASQDYRSTCVVAHIRQATSGIVGLANTQPFTRELGGRIHTFAHNGDLPGLEGLASPRGCYRCVGDSDSEQAFCLLMGRLAPLWLEAGPPSLEERVAVVEAFAAELRPLGPANFIYADGEYLYFHGHKRSQMTLEDIRPPGLFYLIRQCDSRKPQDHHHRDASLGGIDISFSSPRQEVILVASVPLTREDWVPMDEGELIVAGGGRVMHRCVPAGSEQAIATPGEGG
ncbi:MAG: class II glutamine amidotransferase [Gammaproteobacteria bacterium]|nr:class II glutamine amidotransferase [Gammaproteobacteria bacterium]